MVKHEKVIILEFYRFFPYNSYIITFLFFFQITEKIITSLDSAVLFTSIND